MAIKDAPVTELGAPGVTSINGWPQTWETTPEVTWPTSVTVYDRMRRDAHVASSLRAITLPIRRNTWRIDQTPDVRPEVVEHVRSDLGINDPDQGRQRRRRNGVSWDETLQHALLMLTFGHMPLEQVYAIENGRAHLRKLAPRMPQTIWKFNLAPDGGLDSITQWVFDGNTRWREQLIPMDRLVFFVNEREGSDWTGQSLLRSVYGHWLIKQQLIKIDAMACERNGMGVPVVTYGEQGNKTEALTIARNVRSGEDAGLAIPEGQYGFDLKGVVGSVRDILPSIRYHDQEIARGALAMFLDLGHDTGARSLGDTFLDFFVLAQQSVVDYICETVTEHVIRDLVEINYGPDEPYPELTADEITADGQPAADGLAALVKAGVITPDERLEESLRDRWGYPAIEQSTRSVPVAPVVPVAPGPPQLVPVAASGAPTLDELEARLAALRANQGRPVPSR